jgi:hypothetical protein
MKNLILPLFLLACFFAQAQSFSDDFESYTAGSYLAKSSNGKWKTWSNKPGSAEDVKITDSMAHSGSNSIHFSDIKGDIQTLVLLPFGGNHTYGKLTIELWAFIKSGKSGNLSVVGNTFTGHVWPFGISFKGDGTFAANDGNGDEVLNGAYSQSKWMDIRIEGSLNTGRWDLYIDNAFKGTALSQTLLASSLAFYDNMGEDMYVDDVSFNYTTNTQPALDVALLGFNSYTLGLSGYQEQPSLLVRNLGSSTIRSMQISLNYGGQQYTGNFTGITILPYDTVTLKFKSMITLSPGLTRGQATVTQVNVTMDSDKSDDTVSFSIRGIVPAAHKVVIGEEGTGTWCPWCPRGAVYLDRMTEKYFPSYQGIAVHTAEQSYPDPMTNDRYETGIDSTIFYSHNYRDSSQSLGYPTIITDREMADDPLQTEEDIIDRITQAPSAFMVNGAAYNDTTKQLKISVSTHFLKQMAGTGFRLACVLAEDNVSGTTKYYAQENGYAGGGYGPMGGYEKFGSPVPARKMVYNHVGRAIAPTFNGASNVFPSTVDTGVAYTNNFIFDLGTDSTIQVNNVKNLHIIAILFGNDGWIDNGATFTFDQAISNGFVPGTLIEGVKALPAPETMQVYPNPARQQIRVRCDMNGTAKITLTDITGRNVIIQTIHLNGNEIVLPIDGLNAGIYLLKVANGAKTFSSKVIIGK